MREMIVSAVLAVALGSAISAYAQGQGQAPQQGQQSEGQPVTVTGCLSKGAGENEFVITDQKSGDKLSFTASARIEKYVNQTVKLTGKMINQGGQKMFRPEGLDPVAATCEAPK